MRDIVPIVEGLAKALDRDDFDAASCFLSEDCVYDTGGDVVTGRIAIIDSYRAASAWAHATFDEVVYESEIDRADVSDTSVAVIYTDRIRKGERWHTHKCRQTVDVDRRSGKVVAIAHGDFEGEAERLNAFFAACGVVRRARPES
ncbi:hypothetical protein [Methylosinus sporium]|uniref:Nuclear transport factor 2 family protein n=1 Tax=Methylosinus sporium TaxID=428 RepID=A0A2U1SSX8_METSR|nr:hypothetical protein [Methylosinus sporium]PWB94717.1 hypothetical protein C5689_06545 [Methylosinus sporium]